MTAPKHSGGPADSRRAGTLFALGSVCSVQSGQALGKYLMGAAGPAGVVVLRLGFAALLLLLRRPRPPRGRATVLLVLAWGTAIAGMNTVYLALQYLPLGVAATLQFATGPLVLALIGSRRWSHALWALLAACGVLLFHAPGTDTLPLPGVLLAVASGVSMGTYLMLSSLAGARDRDGSLLAWAVLWAAAVWAPAAVLTGRPPWDPRLVLLGLFLALVSAVLPYRLDLAALRRLPPRTMGVLVSLEPVVGALAGLVLLGEWLAVPQWLAVLCVTGASAGAVATARTSANEDALGGTHEGSTVGE
ncbi:MULTISPECIES: DMT family transporter [unclassified Nocardiopsis]|uniref:EamA family transporter n=1 Tax=unclassified Nocardiopsis TaxID=2649073 RepID=UPI00093B33C1|nr:EamA family transporter [Nocardiopsis sp. TSRI0078]